MREDSPQLVRSLDAIAGVLAGLSDERSDTPDAFYDSLCASVCSLTSLRRAVIFRWDSARRRVRAAGSHDIDLAIFADDYVNVDVLPAARDALERDEVVESRDPGLSERYAPLVTDRFLRRSVQYSSDPAGIARPTSAASPVPSRPFGMPGQGKNVRSVPGCASPSAKNR